MPRLTEIHIELLQPLRAPFEGNPRKSIEMDLLDGEKYNDEFVKFIHDGFENNPPQQYVEITLQELDTHQIHRGGKFPEKCFLWVIDKVSIKLIWEKTPNTLRGASRHDRPYVCHTNITGSKSAYIGGEMYFCEDGNTYVNFSSDRYGVATSEVNRQMAIQYIIDCGYQNVIRTDDNL